MKKYTQHHKNSITQHATSSLTHHAVKIHIKFVTIHMSSSIIKLYKTLVPCKIKRRTLQLNKTL